MRVVIPSRRRAGRISKAMRMLPDAVVTVDEREEEEYRRLWGDRVVPHPPLDGIAAIRQWILDNFDDEVLVMCDDDLDCVQPLPTLPGGRRTSRIVDPRDVMQILDNASSIAQEIRAPMFGFSRSSNPTNYHPHQIFGFTTFIQGIVGFVGRPVRYDLKLKMSFEDLDIVMSALLKGRFVFVDLRFAWQFVMTRNTGGLSEVRDLAQINAESDYVKRKWGKFLVPSKGQSNNSRRAESRIAVIRKQHIVWD